MSVACDKHLYLTHLWVDGVSVDFDCSGTHSSAVSGLRLNQLKLDVALVVELHNFLIPFLGPEN
jgi:hypothetical protein